MHYFFKNCVLIEDDTFILKQTRQQKQKNASAQQASATDLVFSHCIVFVFVLLIMSERKQEKFLSVTTKQIINLLIQSKTCPRLLIKLINSDEAMLSTSGYIRTSRAWSSSFNEKKNFKFDRKTIPNTIVVTSQPL